MKAFEKAFAAALLCGAVSFALPSQAAQTANQPAKTGASSQASSTSSNSATAEKPKAEATEVKKTVQPRRVASIRISPKENRETADLNKQSLQAVESGTTPTFSEPATAGKQAVESGKTVVKKRVRRTKVNEKKSTG